MKKEILAMLVAALTLLAPMAANASLVTFTFDAVVTTNEPDGAFNPVLDVGNPLSISVTFDTAATFSTAYLADGITPRVLRYDPNSVVITVSAGGLTETRSVSTSSGGLMFVRDNMLNPDCGNGGEFTGLCGPVDGITFLIEQLATDGSLTQWQLTLRGTILDLITGGALPTIQDPRWYSQEIARFGICNSSANDPGSCDASYMEATLVPEPGTLALLGLGLAGLGFARRRKTA